MAKGYWTAICCKRHTMYITFRQGNHTDKCLSLKTLSVLKEYNQLTWINTAFVILRQMSTLPLWLGLITTYMEHHALAVLVSTCVHKVNLHETACMMLSGEGGGGNRMTAFWAAKAGRSSLHQICASCISIWSYMHNVSHL